MAVQVVPDDGSQRLPPETTRQGEPGGDGTPVALPPISSAHRWGAATDALLAALEREEAAAMAALEAARARARAARRAAHALRQVRQAIRISDDIAAPTPTPDGKGWSRVYDACRICGTTAQPHSGHGRCAACAFHYRKHGSERPESRWRTTT